MLLPSGVLLWEFIGSEPWLHVCEKSLFSRMEVVMSFIISAAYILQFRMLGKCQAVCRWVILRSQLFCSSAQLSPVSRYTIAPPCYPRIWWLLERRPFQVVLRTWSFSLQRQPHTNQLQRIAIVRFDHEISGVVVTCATALSDIGDAVVLPD
jgi:hypothetical protein